MLRQSDAESLCRRPSLDERKQKRMRYALLSPALAASQLTARRAAYTRWGATQTGIDMAKLSSGLHLVLVLAPSALVFARLVCRMSAVDKVHC